MLSKPSDSSNVPGISSYDVSPTSRINRENREIPGGVYLNGYGNLCVLRHHSLASRNKQRENEIYRYMQTGRFYELINVHHVNILMDICKRTPL